MKKHITDGTPCAVKVARTVWSGGKAGNFDTVGLPIAIQLAEKAEQQQQLLRGGALRSGAAAEGHAGDAGRSDHP